MAEIQMMILKLCVIILTVSITVWIKYLTAWLKSKTNSIEDEQLRAYIEQAIDIIASVVMATNQTYVDALKKSGEFDDKAQMIAFEAAKTQILNLLSEQLQNAIITVYGDLDSFLNAKIEELVKLNKDWCFGGWLRLSPIFYDLELIINI